MNTISVVIPVYNEEECLPALLERLRNLQAGGDPAFEFVFVDDGSTDHSLVMLAEEARISAAIKVIAFSRNFGHQAAISAGLDHARGDAVVTMDADLQDPPELIWQMIGKWRDGYDVVYARRTKRKDEGVFKRVTAAAFYRLLTWLSRIPIPEDTGDFRLMSRRAVTALCRLPERHRFIRGLTAWVGFNQTSVEYQRPGRVSGATKYGLAKMLRLAADGIVSFSWVPLRLSLYLGLMAAGSCGLYVFVNLFLWVFTEKVLPGWMSLAALITFLGSLQLVTLGFIGEYIGRILDEVKGRPLYIVRETLNCGPHAASSLADVDRSCTGPQTADTNSES